MSISPQLMAVLGKSGGMFGIVRILLMIVAVILFLVGITDITEKWSLMLGGIGCFVAAQYV